MPGMHHGGPRGPHGGPHGPHGPHHRPPRRACMCCCLPVLGVLVGVGSLIALIVCLI